MIKTSRILTAQAKAIFTPTQQSDYAGLQQELHELQIPSHMNSAQEPLLQLRLETPQQTLWTTSPAYPFRGQISITRHEILIIGFQNYVGQTSVGSSAFHPLCELVQKHHFTPQVVST